MDTGTLIMLIIIMGIAFLLTSQAKNREGKKYGFKNMAKIWVYAIGFLGIYALLNPRIEGDGMEAVRIPIVPVILIFLPIAMITSNIIQRRKRKKAEPVAGGDATRWRS